MLGFAILKVLKFMEIAMAKGNLAHSSKHGTVFTERIASKGSNSCKTEQKCP
jgi:hypothetical protein